MTSRNWNLGEMIAAASVSKETGTVIEPVIENLLQTEISSAAATVIAVWIITLIALRARKKDLADEPPEGDKVLLAFGFIAVMALALLR